MNPEDWIEQAAIRRNSAEFGGPKSVAELLTELRGLFASRNTLYGGGYKRIGPILKAFFPAGITLTTEDEMARFALFTDVAAKLDRYAANFATGGHADSLDDAALYAMMLREIDQSDPNKAPF